VRDMTVGPASSADVREFCRRYHYTGLPGSPAWRWGLWHGPVLHGVIAYNNGTRGMGASVLGADYADKVWHISRLSMADDSPKNSESRLIGGSLRSVQQMFDVWAVVTYADESMGHLGGIYQATNALYTGTTENLNGTNTSQLQFVNELGQRRSWRSVMEAGRKSAPPGWKLVHTDKLKHRYVYILGNKTQRRQRRSMLKLPVLPYPKNPE